MASALEIAMCTAAVGFACWFGPDVYDVVSGNKQRREDAADMVQIKAMRQQITEQQAKQLPAESAPGVSACVQERVGTLLATANIVAIDPIPQPIVCTTRAEQIEQQKGRIGRERDLDAGEKPHCGSHTTTRVTLLNPWGDKTVKLERENHGHASYLGEGIYYSLRRDSAGVAVMVTPGAAGTLAVAEACNLVVDRLSSVAKPFLVEQPKAEDPPQA